MLHVGRGQRELLPPPQQTFELCITVKPLALNLFLPQKVI